MRKSASFLIALFLLSSPCFAQKTSYSLGFSHRGRTSSWNHSFSINKSIGKNLTISGSNRISSTLTRRTGQDRWQDNSSSNLSINYQYSDKIQFEINTSISKKTDNQYFKEPISSGSFSSHLNYKPFESLSVSLPIGAKPLIGFVYKPFESLSISQSLSQSFDRRRQHSDSGLKYNFNISISPEVSDKMNTSLNFSKSENQMRRKKLDMNLSGRLGYDFTEDNKVKLRFSEGRDERYYYSRVDSLEKRSSMNRSIEADFNLKPTSSVNVDSKISYSHGKRKDSASKDPSSPKYKTNRREHELEFTGDLSVKLPGEGKFSYGTSYRRSKADYGKFSLDRKTSDLIMKSSLNFKIGKNSFSTSGSASKFSMNTPDPEEVNDRDYFKSNASLSYRRSFQNGLRLHISVNGNWDHTVYLESERSANNKWTKRYSINSNVSYSLFDKLDLSQRYSLSANYTDYDFEDPKNPKSRISRRMSIKNSLDFPELTENTRLSLNYTFQMSDAGNLYLGKQLLAQDRAEHSVDFSLPYSTEELSISPRYSYRKTITEYYERREEVKNTYETLSLRISYGDLSLSGRITRSWRRGEIQTNNVLSANYSYTF